MIREICKQEDDPHKVWPIPKTLENYTAVTTSKFVFIDSYQLLSLSLDQCAKNLPLEKLSSVKDFVATEYTENRERKFDLLSRKGVYPHSYFSGPEKFLETSLPERHNFFNVLTQQHISDEDWEFVNNVWDEFELNNLGELHDLYVAVDTLILADAMNNFREECYENFQLEVLHYYTLPGLSWDACLRITKAELENIKDLNMYLMIERGIRGGISVISHRHSEANHSQLADYDPDMPDKHILFVDSNNLYGWSMVQKLPYNNFRWMSKEELELDIEAFDSNGDEGCFLEVDLLIPETIHDLTSDYPLAPEHATIDDSMISPFSRSVREARGGPQNFESSKLAPNLLPKQKYVVHIKNLQFYLSKGAVVTKLHRGILFHQRAWMEPYIMFNTIERQLATTESKKAFHKLLNNSCFGKTMENKRKHINVVLVMNERQQIYQTSKPGFKRSAIFSPDLTAVEITRPCIVLDKPIYTGFSVLDLSKLLMYEFFYDVMLPRYPKMKLLFTDTDSLALEIPTKDIYKDLEDEELAKFFDFSNYPKDHPLYDDSKEAKLGLFKDECKGKPIKEFVGLRSKMYSLDIEGGIDRFKAAGVKKSVKLQQLNHRLYKDVLGKRQDTVVTQHLIRSRLQVLETVSQVRTGLSAYDDKRYILDDGVSTLPYGHRDIKD